MYLFECIYIHHQRISNREPSDLLRLTVKGRGVPAVTLSHFGLQSLLLLLTQLPLSINSTVYHWAEELRVMGLGLAVRGYRSIPLLGWRQEFEFEQLMSDVLGLWRMPSIRLKKLHSLGVGIGVGVGCRSGKLHFASPFWVNNAMLRWAPFHHLLGRVESVIFKRARSW